MQSHCLDETSPTWAPTHQSTDTKSLGPIQLENEPHLLTLQHAEANNGTSSLTQK